MSVPPSAENPARPPVPFDAAAQPPFHLWHLPEGPVPWVTLAPMVSAAAATLFSFLAKEPTYAILAPTGLEIWLRWKWHGLISSALVHDGPLHLLFNCYWLWIFGRVLEGPLGRRRFLLLLLGTGWASADAQLAWSGNTGIGLSGVVYGVFGFLWVNRARDVRFTRILTNGLIGFFCAWLVICMFLSEAGIKAVGNAAHCAGLAIGVVAGWTWVPGRRAPARRALCAAGAISLVVLLWAPWQAGWIAAKAYRAGERHDEEAALRWMAKIGPKGRYSEWARRAEAAIHHNRQLRAKQSADLVELAQSSHDPTTLNGIAWRLATSTDEKLRDGKQAVLHARRACELDGWKSAALIDTLAAAHAEAGDFSEAEKWVLHALERSEGYEEILQKHLDAFRSRQPWRE